MKKRTRAMDITSKRGTRYPPILDTAFSMKTTADKINDFEAFGARLLGYDNPADITTVPWDGDRYSDRWFGANFLHFARALRESIDANDTSNAVYHALALGRYNLQFFVRENELDIRIGEAQRQSGGNTGRARSDWQAQADDIWASNPALTKSDVARIIADQVGQSYHTIRKRIQKS